MDNIIMYIDTFHKLNNKLFGYMGKILIIMFSIYLFISCANMASPSGGDYDLDPPKVVRSNPELNERNVARTKIEIVFDELVQLQKVNEKVIVTPPQKRAPVIQAISNRITVQLKDSLIPNTTYTIDFTDAIVDFNEGNPLENFSISFSTGDMLDSLIISGKVLAADNLEPVAGVFVGLHSDLSDSAFISRPFLRISRTNEQGIFSIRGVAEGEYNIFALKDMNNDYIYDNPTEAIAFYTQTVKPGVESVMRTDTLFNEKLEVDSVYNVSYIKYSPDDVLLRLFTSDFKRQYLQKYERVGKNRLKLFFGAPTEMPVLEPLNFEPVDNWYLIERNISNDSITYWITNSDIASIDTLSFRITYPRTDSLNQIVSYADTLNFFDRSRRYRDDNKDKKEEAIEFLGIKTNLSQTIEIYTIGKIEFDEPVKDFEPEKIGLFVVRDSIETLQTIAVRKDSLNPRLYFIENRFNPGETYKLRIDSAMFNSYTGKWNNRLESPFKVKKLEEYGNLAIIINGLDSGMNAFVELLDSSDKPLRKSIVNSNGEALFPNLIPNRYYARIIIDKNNNGVWDTGDFMKQIQPEPVFYFNKYFEIKANWDIEEVWNINELPLDKQKPLDITKNKPKEKDSRRKQLEQQDEKKIQQQQQQQNLQNQNIQ